jgi:hypothetical protein
MIVVVPLARLVGYGWVMSRSRMFDDEVGEHEDGVGTASPRKTIVGGRPPEARRDLPPVPTGIQRLLRLAASDPEFRTKLLAERDTVAPAVGVELTATERLVLRAASVEQLDAMAEHLPPVAPRRDFIRQTAATAAALIGGPALLGCESCTPTRGAQPDEPPPRPTQSEMQNVGGAAPDEPPRPEKNDMQREGGAAPEEPPPPAPAPYPAPTGARPDPPPEPERPEIKNPTRGIRADIPPERE